MPDSAVYVGRPTKWGNPWKLGALDQDMRPIVTRADAVRAYRKWLEKAQPSWIAGVKNDLRFSDLTCWCPLDECPLDEPCHADVLLEIANS